MISSSPVYEACPLRYNHPPTPSF